MDEEKKKALRQRARQLAKAPSPEDFLEEGELYLEFSISSERYAIEAAHVREVYPLRRITPIPCTPSFVLGIVNLRGQIVSVMDIREILGVRDRSISDTAKVVVMFTSDLEVAIVVDDVLGIRTISSKDVTDDLSLTQTEGIEYISGVTRDRTVLLDAKRLLAGDKMIVNEDVN
jgi:purine-binding chemotaxis protein CheW|uniref:Purine-binding chemotaxis protein CheW n=1 Tax=Desulfomonile tiedjei TaxID=2358 RepID=A0A7C4ERW1_9BACT